MRAWLLYPAISIQSMKSGAGTLFFFLVLTVVLCSQGCGDLVPEVPVCGHIAASASANHTIDIDNQVSAVSFGLNWKKAGSNLDLAIRSPGGKWLYPGPGSSINSVSSETSGSYVLLRPEVGVWNVVVRSAGLPRGGEDYCLSARLQGGSSRPGARFNGLFRDYGIDETGDGFIDHALLEVGINVDVPGNYSVDGLLVDLKSGQEIQDRNTTHLNIGPRTIKLDFIDLRSPGPYLLKHLDLYNDAGDGIDTSEPNYTTRAYDVQKIQNQSARLNGDYSDYGTNPNTDGLYNYLTVDVGVDVLDQGNYSLMGSLYDALGREVVWSTGYASLSPGNHTIHMDFDGKTLEGHKFNGSYHLRDLDLFEGDSKENLSLQDLASDAYTTKYYNHSQFVDPAWPIKILSGSGKGEILLTISVNRSLPVFQGRYSDDIVGISMPPLASNWTVTGSKDGYSYDLPGVNMPRKPNNFTVLARGVKNLQIGVRKEPTNYANFTRAWISAQATAGSDGKATIDNDMISPGRYHFKVFGDAAENVSQVALEMKVVKKLVIDGSFKLALNTTGFPSGNYSFNARGLNGSIGLDEIDLRDES